MRRFYLLHQQICIINYWDRIVLHDNECKLFNRIIVLLSCVKESMMVQIYSLYNSLIKNFKLEQENKEIFEHEDWHCNSYI